MYGCKCIPAAALALALAAGLGAAPATPASPPPATETRPAPAEHLKFENGDPIAGYFTALAARFGVMIVQSQAVDAYLLRPCELPDKLEDALAIARQTLEPQGFSVLQSVVDKRLIVRVLPTKEAKKLELAESPVSFGTEGEKIDISKPDRLVTHLFPVAHVDMLDTLRRAAIQDREVGAEVAGGGQIGVNLILTGPALKVQHAVEALAKLDQPTGSPIIARTLQLQHTDAQATAAALNDSFARDTAPLKATADSRTNSLILTGPEDRVLAIMVTLIGQDARRGPLLPRPVRPAPQPLPEIPVLPEIQPGVKPGAAGKLPGDMLDEMAYGGDNGCSNMGRVVRVDPVKNAPYVNGSAFL